MESDDTLPESLFGSEDDMNHIDHGVTQALYEKVFSPYDFNVGTTFAISGKDYAVVAADARLSSGYENWSRNSTKLHPLTPRCVLGSAGCKIEIDQIRSPHKNRNDEKCDLPAEEVVDFVKDVFVTSGEQDAYTGDSV